ncbi:MAG: TIGR04076 family protein [Thermoproteota archaeon]|nr:MAG: TIGR04076 family protein [Candidatus Korarchaeota archaeon]
MPKKTSKLMRVRVRVAKVDGYCPVFSEGDEFLFEDFFVKKGHECNICIHALNAISHFLWALTHGHSPKEMGIGEGIKGYLKCPDPGPPITKGGSVLFELSLEK